MPCTSPPELTEIQIDMFLEGDGGDQIAAHLQSCAHCRHKAQQQAQTQNQVKTLLFRQSCPAAEDLRDYHFGLLTATDESQITQHLAICPYCVQELFIDYASEGAAELAVPRALPEGIGLFDGIRLLVANLATWGSGPPTPALSVRDTALADGDDGFQTYTAGDIQISLEVEASQEQQNQPLLAGLVSGVEIQQMQIHLWQDDRLIGTVPVDTSGSFEIPLPTAAAGAYDLFLSSLDLKVHIPAVEIK